MVHKDVVPQGIVPKVFQGVHAYNHPGIDKTIELIKRRYELNKFSMAELDTLVADVICTCHTCATCKRRTGRHVDTRHYFLISYYPSPLCRSDYRKRKLFLTRLGWKYMPAA